MSDKPVIFISYSHKDEPDQFLQPGEFRWLTYVRSFLDPAAANGQVELWDDRQIDGGGDWKADIDQALERCAVCVFLVSRHSLSSRFILDVEMQRMLERHHARGAHLYPILITSTDLGVAPWLLKLNLKPTNATALELYDTGPRNKVMSELAAEIRRIIENAAASPKQAASSPADSNGPSIPEIVDYSRLPETPYEELVGRETELRLLDDAWASEKTNILSLIAEGGVGKSALVNRWLVRLQEEKYRGAQAVLGWSFFSQGTEQRATSSDAFLNWALETLDSRDDAASSTVKAERIAKAMAERRVLLVLDGVEPLQHGPGGEQGKLKDQGLREFLRRFAAMSFAKGHSLIVLTSRLAVTDIGKWKDGSAPVKDLGHLSESAGAALLTSNGVAGPRAELEAASREAGGHALTLTLLAGLLRDLHNGDVRRRGNIRGLLSDPNATGAERAARMMESYEAQWLAGQPLLQAIMYIIGLFDRPASKGCLDALRAPPVIEGLTEAIINSDDMAWRRAITRLRDVRLLSPQDRSAPDALDAHPLVREWFGERLRAKNENAWRAAHGRVYEYLRDATKEGDNPSLEQLAPLYQAIAHGCRAGRYTEVLKKIYQDRICRRQSDGNLAYYALFMLGATGSDLAAISWFFGIPYEAPVSALADAERAWVLGAAAFALRTQGRIAEALQPQRASLRWEEASNNHTNASIDAFNLGQMELYLGEVNTALSTATKAVAFAQAAKEKKLIMEGQATRAAALLAKGKWSEAGDIFSKAERLQRGLEPKHPLLYSLRGHFYCELLLAKEAWYLVFDRADNILKWIDLGGGTMIDTGLARLAKARALCGFALSGQTERLRSASTDREHEIQILLNDSFEMIRAAGTLDLMPCVLLSRIAFHRSKGSWSAAKRELDEVEEIAEAGSMRLYLCDMAIERARLAFAQIEAFAPLNGMLEEGQNPPKLEVPSPAKIAELKAEAANQMKIADDYIQSCGYHRRDEELAELKDVLAGKRTFASLPPRV